MTENDLRQALNAAMKARDTLRLRVLRGVIAAIKNKTIEKKGAALGEAEIVAVIQREAKQCKETLDFARKAGRAETVAEHEAVLAVIESLLPAQMGEAELAEAIKALIAETGADSLGAVMKALSERHGGCYDGKTASNIARELLA